MIVLIDGVRYRHIIPEKETVLEKAVQKNYKDIFGHDSFYFDKKKTIKSKTGVASIPDGYVIFFNPEPKWSVVEIELASHQLYNHLILQLTKFNRGIADPYTRRKLVDMLYMAINQDEVLRARLKQKIGSGELHKFIYDLISEEPLISVIIDHKTEELKEALRNIRGEIRAVEFRTFQREGITDQIHAYVFEPIITDRMQVKKTCHEYGTKQEIHSYRRGSIIHAVYGLFDEKGVENVTYEECEAVAKGVKPNTAFNKHHFSWYKRNYKKKPNARPHSKKTKVKEYGEEFHTKGRPQKIVEIFHEIDRFCLGLDPTNVQRNCLKRYIKYSHSGEIFCTLHLWNSIIRVWLRLKYNDLDNPPDCIRNVMNIGHWGVGNVEVAINRFKELEFAKRFIRKSFEENKSR